MGPFLKFFLGLYLVIWIVIGLAVIGGGIFLAKTVPQLIQQAQANPLLKMLNGGGQGRDNQNQGSPSDSQPVSPEVMSCLNKQLGPNRVTQLLQGQAQPTQQEMTIAQKCGYPSNSNQQNQGQKQIQPNQPQPVQS